MVHPASEICIWLSIVGIICTLVCLVECGKCPREREHSYYDASTFVKDWYEGVQNSYSSYLSVDHHSVHQRTVPLNNNACPRSELVRFPSSSCGFPSEALHFRSKSLDINRSDSGIALNKRSVKSDSNVSWSSDDVVFGIPDGRTVICSLNFREFNHEKLYSSVNGANQTVSSSCRGHLLYNREASSSLWNINLEKSPSSDSSSPHVNISPSKLDWGHKYLFHSSVASLSLKNTCNESVIRVYEPISTNPQFYPFNFSEVVLGPGEVTVISFAYLPSTLGLSSAELVLQTSFGGFLVDAKGFAVDSPYRLRPLVGFDASSSGWLTKTISLSNPFDETIDLEEVAALISVSESSGSILVDSTCRKQNHEYSYKHSLSNVRKVLIGDSGQLDSMVMAVRPLNNWLITPHRTQSILEMNFLPDSELKVAGALCMELSRPLEGEKDMLVVPFEAKLKKIMTWKDTASSLSVTIEVVGPCDATETTISLSVRNMASHLLKVVKIEEVDSRKLLQINYLEGLLLFPGSVSQVALVTYVPPDAVYDSFPEMPDISMSCKLKILVNDSVSPVLEVPCLDIINICPGRKRELLSYMPDIVDPSIRTESLTSTEKSPELTKVLRGVDADEDVHKEWENQGTASGHFLLDDHELLFPLVPIGKYYAKSITVRNPSQQPVIVQLILNSQETVDNCQTCHGHQQSPPPSSSICNDSSRVSMHGFSVAESAVTEVFLHPLDTASLGPILFHPSNRCEWKSSAFIRSDLFGLELLSLQGFGGALSLVMLEGSELMQRLDFNMKLTFPLNESNIENASSACRRPLLKKLSAMNAGDFPVDVKRIDVSGRECGLDGFVVHHCRPFTLEPGESLELGLSYQSDFSVPIVRRELEFILGVGILVIPMQASIPLNTLNLCGNSIFWEDVKRYFWFIIMVAILFSILWFTVLSHSMDYMIKGERTSIDDVKPGGKSSSALLQNQGTFGKPIRPTKTGHIKQDIITKHTDRSLDCRSKIIPSSDDVKEVKFALSLPSKLISVKEADKLEMAQPGHLTVKTRNEKKRRSRKRNSLIEVCSSQSGNSTPSSPLSPNTTLSPPETCSPPQEKMEPHDSYSHKPVVPSSSRVPEIPIQSPKQDASLGGLRKGASLAIYLPSAAYPVTRLSPSRWAIAPEARAPGPKIQPQRKVQPEENRRAKEDRFAYDIWGNHLSGIHLCKPNSSVILKPGGIDHSNSFFLRGPQQTLMTNSQPPSDDYRSKSKRDRKKYHSNLPAENVVAQISNQVRKDRPLLM